MPLISPHRCADAYIAIAYCSTFTAKYTTDHEWVTFESETNVGVVGITEYAQKALGDVVFVELPGEGTEVAQGGMSCHLLSCSLRFVISSRECLADIHRVLDADTQFIDSIGAVESVKAASDIYAPISGVVESINETLADQPSLLNKSPEKDGTSYPYTLDHFDM